MTMIGSALQNYGVFAFGTWNDRFGDNYTQLKKTQPNLSVWDRTKTAYKSSVEADKAVLNSLKQSGGTKAFINDVGASVTRGGKYLRGLSATGEKVGMKAGLKAFGKGEMKRMNLIGNVMCVAMEAPNIYHSFSDYGAGEGLKQTARVGLELGGFAAGAAAGAAIGSAVPVIGTIIGGIVGGLIAGFAGKKIFGKSKVEEQQEFEGLGIQKEQAVQMVKQGASAEDVEQIMAQGAQGQPSFSGSTPNMFAQGQVNPYSQSTSFGANPYTGSGIQFGDEWMSNSFVSLPVC